MVRTMKWLEELLEEHPLECYIIVCLLMVGLILLSVPTSPEDEYCPDDRWNCDDVDTGADVRDEAGGARGAVDATVPKPSGMQGLAWYYD